MESYVERRNLMAAQKFDPELHKRTLGTSDSVDRSA
jgi:hypothetical protein